MSYLYLWADAAHSVIPPTGEGFNSGAEDVEVVLPHIEALDQWHDSGVIFYQDMHERPGIPYFFIYAIVHLYL